VLRYVHGGFARGKTPIMRKRRCDDQT
jgi:hypothetical protein